ncbi:MAG: threonine--tRNA ligase [Candidatus Bathyarchaeia archaeon]
MRILQLHCDFIEYEPVAKEIPSAEETEKRKIRIDEVVVLFVSVEKGDDVKVARKAIEDTKLYLNRVGSNRILLYPYAHLSRDLASPTEAFRILLEMENYAKELGIETTRSVFGWNKRFTLSIKGHPLAEQSRYYSVEESVKLEVKKPAGKKEYLILTPDGKIYRPEEYSYGSNEDGFRCLVEKEALGIESTFGREPEYIRHMKKFGIDWETMSDLGHMHYSPEGTAIYESVAAYAKEVANSLPLPIYHVRGSNMFNLDLPPVKEHAELFGDRLYQLTVDNRTFIMRYAACHQQFAIIRNWLTSYRNLPFGAFEIADSYRLEQSGELLLSFRVRRMNMPDLHIFCRDLEEAKEWLLKLHERIYYEARSLGREYYSLYNLASRQFLDEHKEWLIKLAMFEGKPVLLCIYPSDINYYWVLNIEYHIIDIMNRPREVGTVQIDVGNAKRFGIKYIDHEGKENFPVILHSAIIGTIERYIYMLFDTALKMKHPMLPTWVCPTQVRLIPISIGHLEYAKSVAAALSQVKIRVDIDDRNMTLSSKIREAEMMWIPFIGVIGDNEVKEGNISLRIRADGKQCSVTISELTALVFREVDGKPQITSHLPQLLSFRPRFV